ncbi:hypothetical protein LCGC14_0390720 [marine sediment metagenome]|uniref:DNA N-6-adenine-methyltransferase (Dam) n=1 Tax=marine sediment metagenome TaxID=412755 RepID=A0A0F9THR7_9ZZZZ
MVKGFTHESTYNESVEWYTPREVFKALGIEFDIDPCSPGSEIVPWVPATKHYTYLDDGLSFDWDGRVWMNPPYGGETKKWLKHLSISGNGIALIFARTDTKWFHEYVPDADAVCFIKGRVQFIKCCVAGRYARGQYNPKTDYFVDPIDGKRKKGGCGSASMLIAYGKENAEVLYRCNLGLTMNPHQAPAASGVRCG